MATTTHRHISEANRVQDQKQSEQKNHQKQNQQEFDDDDDNDDDIDALERNPSEPSSPSTTSSPSTIPSTTALCLCMLTHSYLLISVFPYSGYMAMHLIDSVNEETVGSYAGLLASAFMLGRAATSYAWGQCADTYGRTTVLYFSLAASAILSIWFGLCTNFVTAVLVRFLLGLSNGIMASINTIVSELAPNEKAEAKHMSIVIGMWGWGFLISPALSGVLAEPIQQYPDSTWWTPDSPWRSVLEQYPFLLPNILGCVLCLIAALMTALFVQETLPDHQRRHMCEEIKARCLRRNGVVTDRSSVQYQAVKSNDSEHFHSSDDDDNDEEMADESIRSKNPAGRTLTMVSILSKKKTRTYLIVFWAYSLVSLTIDETFPLFCISKDAGFGLPEKQIGSILSVCGLIFAVFQYGVSSFIYNRFGLLGAIRMGSMLSAPLMFLVPFSLLLNHHPTQNVDETTGPAMAELRPVTFVYLAIVMAAYRIFALVFFSNISVAVNQTVPTEQRATMNGLSMLGGSIAKGIGPAFAGVLVTFSVLLLGRWGSVLIFGVIGLIGCGVAIIAFFLLTDDNKGLVESTECDDDNGADKDGEFVLEMKSKSSPL